MMKETHSIGEYIRSTRKETYSVGEYIRSIIMFIVLILIIYFHLNPHQYQKHLRH